MKTLKQTLDASVNEILTKLPLRGKSEFDTHDFINIFLNLDDNTYTNLLAQHKDAKGPFKSFHGCIARHLNSIEKKGLIVKVMTDDGKKKRVASMNIKARKTHNQVWVKI